MGIKYIFPYKEKCENAPTLPHFQNCLFLVVKNERKRIVYLKMKTKVALKMWEISSHTSPTHPTFTNRRINQYDYCQ